MVDGYTMLKYFCHILKKKIIIDYYLNIFHIIYWKINLKKYPNKKIHLFRFAAGKMDQDAKSRGLACFIVSC